MAEKDSRTRRVLGTLECSIWKRPRVEAVLINDDDADAAAGTNVVSDHLLLDLMYTWTDNSGIWIPQFNQFGKTNFQLVTGLEQIEGQDQSRDLSAVSSSPTLSCDWVLLGVRVKPVADAPDEDLDGADVAIEGLPAHVAASYHIILQHGELEKPLVQRLVMSGHVCTLGLPWSDAAMQLPSLVAALSSPGLRQLFIYANIREDFGYHEQVLDAVCKIATLGLVDAVVLCGSLKPVEALCSSLHLDILCSSLTHFGFHGGVADSVNMDNRRIESQKIKQLFFSSNAGPINLAACIFLTRFDCRLHPIEDLGPLLDVLTQCTSLIDVGLRIRSPGAMKSFLDSRLHTRILTLRLYCTWDAENGEEALTMLVSQGLRHSTSTIQFVDFHGSLADHFWLLPENTKSLKALRLRWDRPEVQLFALHGGLLPELLRSSNLLFLDLTAVYRSMMESFMRRDEWWECEWDWANALINNFCLCSLSLPWTNPAAEAYAAQLLQRNQLYRAAKLLQDPQVKPNTAKLFVCGHAQVGKTTLCRALQQRMREERPKWLPKSISGTVLCGGQNSEPERTRGMEFHSLAFGRNKKKLLICDLAGQEEYHVFHHYFMNASNNDVFLVVCKFDRHSPAFTVFEQQLVYWLRSIVSHRSARIKHVTSFDANVNHGHEAKPKVVVVVNFFDQSEDSTDLGSIINKRAVNVMNRFSEVLDFALVVERSGVPYENVFGLNAKTAFGVYPLKLQLKSLLEHFAKSAFPIPKLCYELSAKLTHKESPSSTSSWLCPRFSATQHREQRLLTSCDEILKLLLFDTCDPDTITHDACTKVQAALQELHNQGFVVFLPPSGSMEEAINKSSIESVKKFLSTGVITDISWFCNELVGCLLGTHIKGEPRRDCPWVWSKDDIKFMLLRQGCKEGHLEEILRYLENLELCVSLVDSESSHEKGSLLFPALMRVKEIKYPTLAVCKVCNATPVHFFGRRIRCADSEVHLIPFGVFTRLQVKLHKEYCVYEDSFELGDGWVSFLKGNVGVVVRFGSGDVNEAWENKQWVDILIFCPGSCSCNVGGMSRTGSESCHSYVAGNEVMDRIKNLLYATCKLDGFGGIPTVKLEEWVLQSKDPGESWRIMEKVRKEGLQESHQEWSVRIGSTPVIDLLLPKEIEQHVKDQLNVLEEEFALIEVLEEKVEDAEVDGAGSHDASKQQPTGEFKVLFERMQSLHRSYDDLHRSRWEMVRQDIRHLGVELRQVLQQAERNIIANCSTRLLRHELRQDRAYPLYPYLAEAQGKLAPLWRLMGKRAVVHFMCESPTERPHPVEGQKGKEVTLEVKEWVAKVAKVMVPAVRLICLLGRLATSLYLPSAHVFIPTPDGLVSGLGLEKEAFQHVILPKALEALLDQLPNVNYKDFLTERGSKIDEQEVKDVMQALLRNVEVDMASDFGLQRVIFNEIDGNTYWVCKDHVGHGKRLLVVPNPYKT